MEFECLGDSGGKQVATVCLSVYICVYVFGHMYRYSILCNFKLNFNFNLKTLTKYNQSPGIVDQKLCHEPALCLFQNKIFYGSDVCDLPEYVSWELVFFCIFYTNISLQCP